MRAGKMIFTPLGTSRGRHTSALFLTGFTLVELLVVLSVIAMLMGILMPTLHAARRASYKTGCKENLHGCMIAFQMYLDDNQRVMPTITNMPNSVSGPTEVFPITKVLGKYLSGPEALKCPADPKAKFFREQGSSYEYNTYPPPRPPLYPEGPFNYHNTKIEGKGVPITRGGQEVIMPWAEIWVLRDYEDFHGRAGKSGSRIYFYADNLVADRERNK